MIELRGIDGFNYQAGSDGYIHSLLSGRRLKGQRNGPKGYLQVSLRVSDGTPRWRSLYVHHLIAGAFIGPRPEGLFINHKNGDKTDNRPVNLEYCTRLENMAHAKSLGLIRKGEEQGGAKLKASEVEQIRLRRRLGYSYGHIAREFNVHRTLIGKIIRGQIWR